MNPLLLLTALFSLLAAALPPNTPATPPATVTISFAPDTHCTPDDAPQAHISPASGCVAFPPGTQALRVTAVVGDDKLRYNSLRVYGSGDCSGGWTLEPALTCAGRGGQGCACSQVAAFGSIRLVVDE